MKLLVIESSSGLIELAKNDEKLGAIYGATLLGTVEVTEPGEEKDPADIVATAAMEFARIYHERASHFGRTAALNVVQMAIDGYKPKQTVTKEALLSRDIVPVVGVNSTIEACYYVPINAKNIRCTYEVEE